jgi:hypothetical protein
MISGMRKILWEKDAMCRTINSVAVIPSLQNADGKFKYAIPCYVLPQDAPARCSFLDMIFFNHAIIMECYLDSRCCWGWSSAIRVIQ